MSKKDVDKYFNQIADQYLDMIQNLKDMEKEVSLKIISPDRLDQIKMLIEPIKINYERISYIMYLLNKPNNKERKRRYEKQHKQLIAKLKENDLEAVKKENATLLDKMKL